MRIAVGLNPYDVELDPLPRDMALKSWHAKWDPEPSGWANRYQEQGGNSWYKSVGAVSAKDARLKARPRLSAIPPAFSARYTTDYTGLASTKALPMRLSARTAQRSTPACRRWSASRLRGARAWAFR